MINMCLNLSLMRIYYEQFTKISNNSSDGMLSVYLDLNCESYFRTEIFRRFGNAGEKPKL